MDSAGTVAMRGSAEGVRGPSAASSERIRPRPRPRRRRGGDQSGQRPGRQRGRPSQSPTPWLLRCCSGLHAPQSAARHLRRLTRLRSACTVAVEERRAEPRAVAPPCDHRSANAAHSQPTNAPCDVSHGRRGWKTPVHGEGREGRGAEGGARAEDYGGMDEG